MSTHSSPHDATPTAAPPPPLPSFIYRGHSAPVHTLEFFAGNRLLVSGDEQGWLFVWDLWTRRNVLKWRAHGVGNEHGDQPSGILTVRVLALYPSPTYSREKEEKEVECGGNVEDICQHPPNGATQCLILSHGRDHRIHVWDIREKIDEVIHSRHQKTRRQRQRRWKQVNEGRDNSRSHTSTMNSKDDNDNGDTFSLKPVFTLPVSVLNFCKMDVVGVPLTTTDTIHEKNVEWSGKTGYRQILVGVPSALDASKVDVYDLLKPAPVFQGVAAPSTSSSNTSMVGLAGMSKGRGAVMAIRIFLTDSSNSPSLLLSPSPHGGRLNLLVGYEDGSLSLFQEEKVSYASDSQQSTMSLVWTFKGHREPVLGIALSASREFAISCGSDNNLIRYTLANNTQGAPETLQRSLKSNGIAEVQIRDDNKILALAGWDGKIRIFSCKTLKPLAVLTHHRESLYSIALASVTKVLEDETAAKAASSVASTIAQQTSMRGADLDSSSGSSDSSEDDEEDQRRLHQYTRQHWLAAGGKENRISQWQIY